jgi:integrase
MKFTLRKRKDTGSWEVDWFENGKRKRRSLGKMPKYEAEAKVNQMHAEFLLGTAPSVTKACTDLEPFLRRYFDWARNVKHKTERSISTDKSAVKQFLKHVPVTDLKDFHKELIDACISNMKKNEYKPATINIVIRVWKNLLNRAVDWGIVYKNPFSNVKQIKVVEKPMKFCTKQERDLFLEKAKENGANIHLVCALGFYAGLRKREISFARWEWFDFEENLIHVESYENFCTKSKKNRTLPLASALKNILESYKNGKKEGFIFAEAKGEGEYRYHFRRAFNTVRTKTELKWVTPHVMRHTFGSLLAQQGVSLYKISKWMGHSHSRVTEIYAHLQEKDEEIEKL